MATTITQVKINGTLYPYVQNTNGFEVGVICYDDGGTIKKISAEKIEEFVTA